MIMTFVSSCLATDRRRQAGRQTDRQRGARRQIDDDFCLLHDGTWPKVIIFFVRGVLFFFIFVLPFRQNQEIVTFALRQAATRDETTWQDKTRQEKTRHDKTR